MRRVAFPRQTEAGYKGLALLLAMLCGLLVLGGGFLLRELRWSEQFHLSVYPGQPEAEALAEVGRPRYRIAAGDPYLGTIYRSGNYLPVPDVRGWDHALVYTRGWYLQVVYVDAEGRVLCLVTSAT